MKTVDVVIRIPCSELEYAKKGYTKAKADVVYRAIENGTVLPKSHGRLIDADDYLVNTPIRKSADEIWIKETYVYDTIMDAPTIIEANKAGE